MEELPCRIPLNILASNRHRTAAVGVDALFGGLVPLALNPASCWVSLLPGQSRAACDLPGGMLAGGLLEQNTTSQGPQRTR